MKSDYLALSLFSGAGGLDVGLAEAGFRPLAMVEIDPHCCATLRSSSIHTEHQAKVIEADIRQISPQSLMDDLGLKPGALDLLSGGPPCQAFSQIGKQQALADERGLLLFEMPRFAQALRPRAVLIEQVRGLLWAKDARGRKGGVLQRLINDLEGLGYATTMKVLNSAEYGVPQLRQRVFVLGILDDITFDFPPPTHAPRHQDPQLFTLEPYAVVGDAIEGLPVPVFGNGQAPPTDSHVDVTPPGDRRRIAGVPEGEWLAAQAHLPEAQRCNLTKKDTTKFRRLSRQEPSLTLRCGEIFFHPTDDRYLTPREYMRLHGYPDTYVLKGPVRGRSGTVRTLDQHRQVANSVPPPVAKALGEAIARRL